MVLEPWITPSMFYQFLGKKEGEVAFDTYTFCEVLGVKEANKQLRRHWNTWVTREIIQELAASGAVNSLRLPVGDYMYKPYGPYGQFALNGYHTLCLIALSETTNLTSTVISISCRGML